MYLLNIVKAHFLMKTRLFINTKWTTQNELLQALERSTINYITESAF